MGTSCSSIISDHDPELLEKDQTQAPRIRHISRPDTEPEPEPGPEPEPPIVKTTPPQRPLPVVTDSTRSKSKMSRSGRSKSKPKGPDPHEWTTVHVLDQIIDGKVGASGGGGGGGGTSSTGVTATTAADYEKSREELRRRERALGFEHKLASAATPKELRVDQILQALKRDDDKTVFAAAPARTGFGGQQHGRFAGDHFLSNRALIDQSKVFRVAKKVPKGAHLHIHFNACLLPNVLLEIAAGMEQMYITSDLPLVDAGPQSHQDPRGPEDRYHNLRRAKIQFSIMAQPASTGDLFAAGYRDREGAMRFREFLAAFPQRFPEEELGVDAMTWLQEKLVFREEEAHDLLQTVGGAWGEFNTRTQMMKGLFNYETAYRTYTRRCLEDFVADNIQYAEIRPNFMDTNQVWRDDGSAKLDNVGIMHMIIEEYDKFQTEARAKGKAGGYFGGMKIIYCCPRSYPKDKVAHGLKQCLEFKKRWPQWIAGFDLVGEESKGNPLHFFVPEFLQFQQDCQAAGVEIPFLFHCGETLDTGSETDANLLDALLLRSKRIGHGFALARHPYVMERMKQQGVCLEVCPISNEVLGLTPRANGHAIYNLLANNVHCTVNSDNGTLFNSTLSHDFYQVMVGKSDMTLYGWKQLIEWSLQHSCLSTEEYETIYGEWARKWDTFLDEVIVEFGSFADTTIPVR